MNIKLISILAATFIILIALSFWGGRWTAPSKIEYVDKPFYIEKTKTDTITKEIRLGTTVINKRSDTTIYIDNSATIQTKPFTAVLDTIAGFDTLSVRYSFPQDSFSFKILPKPIQFKELTTTIYKVEVMKIERPLYIDVLSHSGAAILAAFIGYFIGKK
jgi:hypothetical protein